MKKKLLLKLSALALALMLTLSLVGTVFGEEGTDPTEIQPALEWTEIWTVADLQAIGQAHSGNYRLMADLDMGDVAWVGPEFSGIFDGNGHTLLNLTLAEPGSGVRETYDGNLKGYSSNFVGLFSIMENATVQNLNLLNVRALVDTDLSCFVGSIAGYAMNSIITNCTVTGTLELRAYNQMFGIGGVLGYGSGHIENCQVDVTLISTDTDESKDEMFLGGICSLGFLDISGCTVKLDGYGSEYGYVHTGGLVGMVIRHTLSDGKSVVTDNTVTGKITFFESNPDRRAYCSAFIGERLTPYCRSYGNKQEFKRDERRDYSAELRPEMCQEPQLTEETVAATCNSFGYTVTTCGSCGYAYKDNYTLYGDHQVAEWTLVQEPTLEQEGLSTGICTHCGAEAQRSEPKLEPPPTEAPTEPAQTEPTEALEPEGTFDGGLLEMGMLATVVLCGILMVVVLLCGVFTRRK